jgi:hypothetical protein
MKHVVELKYTNPSHEHVSLRRRVETVNRVVEAQSADEALNRAANQQRSLGFRIQSANIVEQKVEELTSELISEETELEEGKIAKALAVGAMALASMGAKAHTDTTKSVAQLAQERPALAQRLHDIGASGQVPASDKRASELQRKQDQEMPASERRAKELKKEEVELEEANMRFDYEAAARPKSSDVKNFLNRDKNPRAAAASKKYIRRMTKLGGLGPNQTKKDTEAHMKAHFEEVEQIDEGSKRMSAAVKLQRAFDKEKTASDASRKRGEEMLAQARAEYAKKQAAKTNEEVEQVDEAQKKLKPSYWKAEWRLGTQSEVDKNNKKIYDKLAKTDPDKAKKFHDNLMKIRKEEVEQIDELDQKTLKSYIKKNVDSKAYEKSPNRDAGLERATTKVARNQATSTLKKKISNLKYTSMAKHKNPFEYQVSRDELANRKVSEDIELDEASKEGKSVMYGMRASMKAMDLRHGVDSDKRDAGYKMSPAVKAAQAKSDALSKVEKPVQAGTLAALKRREMKKEAVDPGSMKVVNKKVKAADKMIKAAKGKVNKIDLKPTLDLDSYKD